MQRMITRCESPAWHCAPTLPVASEPLEKPARASAEAWVTPLRAGAEPARSRGTPTGGTTLAARTGDWAQASAVGSRETAAAPRDRGAELATAVALIGAATARQGQMLVVEGPTGIGRSRLLEEITDRAQTAGMTVARARGSELECDYPFGVV